MALLLDAVTTDTVGDAEELTGPCDVYIQMPTDINIVVNVEIQSAETAWQSIAQARSSTTFLVDRVGAYELRASRTGGSAAVSVEAVQ